MKQNMKKRTTGIIIGLAIGVMVVSPILTRAITEFDRDLKTGMTRIDVKQLQILLNTDIDTKLADSGLGSPGQETTYFGSLTKRAVIRFQEKYAKDILTPLGLVSGTGFVGRATREKLNTILEKVKAVSEEQEPSYGKPSEGEEEKDKEEKKELGLTVRLAKDSPIDSDLVAGQALASLAKFSFTNNDNKEAKVTQLKFKRIGVSADTTLAKVYLFEGTKRLANPASALSTGIISINEPTGIITIPANSSKTITVKSDIATGTNSEIVGMSIQAADDIISNAISVNGSFPINGNLMSIRSITLAEVDFNNSTTPAANTSVALQNNYTVWQNTVSIPTKAVELIRFSLEKTGTINNSNLQNFRLYINNIQVGSAIQSLDEDDFVTFDLSDSPKKLEVGYSTIRVLSDIIGGSSRTFKFSLKTTGDAVFTDSEYGINVLPTANSSSFSVRASGTQTVSTGSVKIVQKSGGPVDVINSISAETIGEFTMTAAGERVKVESLEIEVLWVEKSGSTTVGSLRDGLVLVDGVQMGSAADIDVDRTTSDSTGTTYSFSSSLILEPGEPVTLIVKADIYDNDGTNNLQNDDTLQVNILAGSSNAEGMSSSSAINVPSSPVTGQTVEIEQGELDLGKYAAFSSRIYIVPINDTKLAHFTLMSSHEPVDLNTITVNLATVAGAVDASDDLSNLYVTYGDNTTTIKAAVVDDDNSWTINYRLEKHTTLEIAVYADVSLSAYAAGTTDTITPKLTVSGTSVKSGASAASSQTTGQTITFDVGEEGDLTGQMAGDSPLDRIVAGSTAAEIEANNPRSVTGAKFKFTAVGDDFLLKTIKLELDEGANVSGAVLGIVLKDGETVVKDKYGEECKEKFGAGTGGDLDEVEFTGLKIAIPADTSKTLTFDLLLNTPDSDISPASSQANVQLELDKIKYENSLGTEISDSNPGPSNNDPDANNLYVYKSIPFFTHIDLGNNKIYNGMSTKLYSFKVKADSAGDVALKQLKFGLNWNDANSSTLVLDTFRLKRDSQDITNIVTIQDTLGNSLESITNTATPSHSAVVFTFATEETIPAGQEKTYDLYARPSGFQYKSTAGADTVVINLKGGSDESAHNGSNRYLVDDANSIFQLAASAGGAGTDYNLIWSDNSSVRHSYSADNVYSDWANGYLVLDLPLDGEAWQGQ